MNWTNRKSVTYSLWLSSSWDWTIASKDSSLLGSNSWCSVVPFARIHQGVSEDLTGSHVFRNEKKFSHWRLTYPLRRLLCGLALTCFIFLITDTGTFFQLPCMCFGRSSPIEMCEFFSLQQTLQTRSLREHDVKRAKRGRALLLFCLPKRGALKGISGLVHCLFDRLHGVFFFKACIWTSSIVASRLRIRSSRILV